MEQLYAGVKEHQGDWVITKDSINWMRQQVGVVIEPAFRKVWMNNKSGGPIEFIGLLEVIKQVVEQYIEGFLAIDELYTPFTVESLEVNLPQPFGIQLGSQQKRLLLNGKIDRVDEKNGLYRMVDYKTGGDKTTFQDVAGLFERDGKRQNKAALQTLIYSWMFQKQFPQHTYFEPALIPLREINKEAGDTRLFMNTIKAYITAENIKDILPEVEENLRLILQEIFDENVPFDQTNNPKICEYCDYKGICKRC